MECISASVTAPSGRLVVGTPEAVTARGEAIEPADGLAAQARAFTPDRRHHGLLVVARVEPGRRRVLAVTGDECIRSLVVDCTSQPATQEELLVAG